MMIVAMKKLKKVVLLITGVVVVTFVGAGIFTYGTTLRQSKADRSNAMQVAKSVLPEPAVPVNAPDFFTEYRLEREKIRSERSDILRDIMKNAKADDTRHKAQDTVLKMTMEKQRESEIEGLIKARGYSDALVFIRDNSVSAVVKTTSLTKEDVVQVAEVISRVAGVKAEDITISGKP